MKNNSSDASIWALSLVDAQPIMRAVGRGGEEEWLIYNDDLYWLLSGDRVGCAQGVWKPVPSWPELISRVRSFPQFPPPSWSTWSNPVPPPWTSLPVHGMPQHRTQAHMSRHDNSRHRGSKLHSEQPERKAQLFKQDKAQSCNSSCWDSKKKI